MFISGLVSRMPNPPASAVDRYFDEFGATAIHLWETGLPNELNGWHAMRPGARWLSWLHGDGTVVGTGMTMGGYPPNGPGRIGYQLGDEPGNWDSMNEILGGLAAVANVDPGGLRILNFSWWADELDAFVDAYCDSPHSDIISYDMYSRGGSAYEVLSYFREAGLRCQMPYWRYIKGMRCDDTDEGIQSESDLRWDAFTGLTYGYTGHSWFIYQVLEGEEMGIPPTFFNDADDWNATKTPRFDWAAQVNRELQSYGRAITQLLSTDIGWKTDVPVVGIHPPAGAPAFTSDMDPHLSDVALDGFLVNLLMGFFVDVNGDRYVILQNPNHSGGSFPTSGDDSVRGTLHFDFGGASGVNTSQVLVLDGAAGAVRTQALSDGTLPFDIAAGDILFFKYDTGRPFAGYP